MSIEWKKITIAEAIMIILMIIQIIIAIKNG